MVAFGIFIICLCVAVVLLTYMGYPLAILIASRGKTLSQEAGFPPGTALPSVSVIICAYNEEKAIGQKLKSVAATDYSGEMEVLVGDDGSTDQTESEVASVLWPACRYVKYPRQGKARVLADLVARATGDILVFTDADPIWRRDTLRQLIAPFASPAVGAVGGHVMTAKKARRMEEGDGAFRRYENFIRTTEDRLFGAISADGGLFAIRRGLYQAPPEGVTDDFFISTAAVAKGKRIAFAESAIAEEESIVSPLAQWRRRLRITVRGLASVYARRELLSTKRYGLYAVGLFFHKVMRRVAPLFLFVGAVVALIMLLTSATYWQVGLLAVIGFAFLLLPLIADVQVPKIVSVGSYALLHLGGLAAGTILFLAGKRYVQWSPAKERLVQATGGEE